MLICRGGFYLYCNLTTRTTCRLVEAHSCRIHEPWHIFTTTSKTAPLYTYVWAESQSEMPPASMNLSQSRQKFFKALSHCSVCVVALCYELQRNKCPGCNHLHLGPCSHGETNTTHGKYSDGMDLFEWHSLIFRLHIKRVLHQSWHSINWESSCPLTG